MSDKNNVTPIRRTADPDTILKEAMGSFTDVMVLGYDRNGDLEVRGTDLFEDGAEALWVLENVKMKLLSGDYEEQ